MRSKYIIFYGFILVTMQLMFIANCAKKERASTKIKIVVSIAPLADFVEQVGGNKVDVVVMVPPGASPHAYEPRPNQLIKLNNADVFVKVGTPVEFELSWMDKIISMNNSMLLINASENLELIFSEHYHLHGEPEQSYDHTETPDPHIWLSPVNAQTMVENIYQGLIKIDPGNRTTYENNKDEFIKKLQTLDVEIKAKLAEKKIRKFMIYHPAWGYFAHQYNLHQIPIEVEGKEPTVKGIQQIIERAKNNNIKIIFASPQFQTASAELIAREINSKLALISPMAKDYISNIRKFVELLYETME